MSNFLRLFLAVAFSFHLGACTSSEPSEQTTAGDMAEGSTGEVAEVSSGDMASDFGDDFGSFEEGSAGGDFGGGDDFGAGDDFALEGDAATSDLAATEPSAPLEGDAVADPMATDPMATDPMAADQPISDPKAADTGSNDPLADLGSDDWAAPEATTETPATEDPFGASTATTDELAGLGEPAMTDSSAFGGTDSFATTDTFAETGEVEAPNYKPLNKMLTVPYTKEGILVNAIYIARPGDTIAGISQKIYGSDRASELRAVNSHLASRDLVVGDKVYYNSPQRPTDDSKILVYYEDVGLNPEVYVAQSGDNIRAVGKQLLGDSKSWKELYATNMDVESKDILDEGTRLRYWAGDFAPPAPPVQASMPMEPEPQPQFEAPVQEVPPMPDQPELAQNDMEMPPPEPIEEMPPEEPVAAATTEQFQPPPPPPPANIPAPQAEANVAAGEDTTALIAGALLLLAAVAMVIIIRKRKAKKNIDFQTATHTHIE